MMVSNIAAELVGTQFDGWILGLEVALLDFAMSVHDTDLHAVQGSPTTQGPGSIDILTLTEVYIKPGARCRDSEPISLFCQGNEIKKKIWCVT